MILIILYRPHPDFWLESIFVAHQHTWILVCTDRSPPVSTYVIILLNILFSPRWFVQQKQYQPLSLQCWLACTLPCYFLLCLIKIYVTTSVELLPFQYTQQACNSRERIILLCIMKSIKKVVGQEIYLAQILLYTTKKNCFLQAPLRFIIREQTIIHQKMDFLNKIAEQYREKTIYSASVVVVSFVPIAKASHARVHWRSVTCSMYLTVDLRYCSM